ncbi:hypothetical protein [Pseudotenacibaculum haliotis]|uniref:Lipoprotein n=1 Tax=Pseudotenacibaculum haliotis TaxID=1862138 RepID=A0ABW5LW00_9FLAO
MSSKNIFLLIAGIVFLGLTSCKESRNVKKIDFTNHYKFSSEIEDKIAKDTVPWKYQFSAVDYAAKGDYQNALKHWDLAMHARERTLAQSYLDSILQLYSKVKATDYIVEQAKKHQVVIINEAHQSSMHRMFTRTLLQELYDNGYRNLGLEALANGARLDSLLNSRKYPVQETGYYVKDPQFGNLLRDALEIGYTLFDYENIGKENGKFREIGEAKNIKKFIDKKPNEKFLIFCGFDHVLEGTHRAWEKAMAGRLKEYTGIDPLTIHQVAYSESGNTKFNHPLLKALHIQESTILVDKDQNPYQYKRGKAYTDIAVFHPNTQYINKRPDWLFKNGNKNVSISLHELEIEFPVMVLAYKEGENINTAIPYDITEAKSKEENCHLGLQKGNYTIVVTNGKESIKFEEKVK